MKKFFMILSVCSLFGLSACESMDGVSLNPLDYAKRYNLKDALKLGYVNRDLRKLKGQTMLDVASRGVPISGTEADGKNTKVYLNHWGIDLGSGIRTTKTTTTYLHGVAVGQMQKEHVDTDFNYAINYFLVDENGIILDYIEMGNAVPELSDDVMERLQDLMEDDS